MNMTKKYVTIIVLASIQIACGEVSYKRGASVRDIENAHKACRGVPESAFSECLQKQGWEIQKFDDSDLFAETSVTDNRGTPPAKKAAILMDEELQTTHPSPTTETESTTPANATSDGKPTTSGATVARIPTPVAAAPVDPLKPYKINSWWKFGATPTQLKSDEKRCVAELGDAHKPEMTTQTYTRGMIECLHKNGWKALKAIK